MYKCIRAHAHIHTCMHTGACDALIEVRITATPPSPPPLDQPTRCLPSIARNPITKPSTSASPLPQQLVPLDCQDWATNKTPGTTRARLALTPLSSHSVSAVTAAVAGEQCAAGRQLWAGGGAMWWASVCCGQGCVTGRSVRHVVQ